MLKKIPTVCREPDILLERKNLIKERKHGKNSQLPSLVRNKYYLMAIKHYNARNHDILGSF